MGAKFNSYHIKFFLDISLQVSQIGNYAFWHYYHWKKICQTINKKFLLRMAKPCYFTHIIIGKNENSHIVKSRTIIFTFSIVAYARISNLQFQLFPESDNKISLSHTPNYIILQLLSLIQLSIPILYDKLIQSKIW